MATSNSFDFSRNGNQLITLAYKRLGMIPTGQSATAQQISDGREMLNIIQNDWIADDIRVFDKQEAILKPSQSSFVFGSDTYLYICKLSHTSGSTTAPVTGSNWFAYWEKKEYATATAYADATAYVYGQVVTVGAAYHICIVGHTSATTTNPTDGTYKTTYWAAIANHANSTPYISWNRLLLPTATYGKVFDVLSIWKIDDESETLLDVTNDYTVVRSTALYIEFPWSDHEIDYTLRFQYTTFAEDVDGALDDVDYNSSVYKAIILELAVQLTPFAMMGSTPYLALKAEASTAFKNAKYAQGNKGSVQMKPWRAS